MRTKTKIEIPEAVWPTEFDQIILWQDNKSLVNVGAVCRLMVREPELFHPLIMPLSDELVHSPNQKQNTYEDRLDRLDLQDLMTPMLAAKLDTGQIAVFDGRHRCVKLYQHGVRLVCVQVIAESTLLDRCAVRNLPDDYVALLADKRPLPCTNEEVFERLAAGRPAPQYPDIELPGLPSGAKLKQKARAAA